MSNETIKTYQGSSIGVSQCLVTLENFVGDVENVETVDDGTFDCSDAVTAINALIWEMEKREAEIERLKDQLAHSGREREAFSRDNERLRAALKPFSTQIELIECTSDHTYTDDVTWPLEDCFAIKLGDLRAARDALNQQNAGGSE